MAINPNNIDDSEILGERLDRMKPKTSDRSERYFDDGYSSSDNDEKCHHYGITPLKTAVRERHAVDTIEI